MNYQFILIFIHDSINNYNFQKILFESISLLLLLLSVVVVEIINQSNK